MANWVDFAAIKSSVELAPLLQQYQVKLHRSGRDQYRGCCPIHGGDGREAFHANLTKNVFHCFACGAGGTVLDFVAAMDRCSLREAALKLAHPAVPHHGPVTGCPRQLVTKKSKPLSPLGFTLRGVDTTHPYLAGRGIATATAREFGIGVYGGPGILSGRLVIPIHNARGELVAYCGRAVDGSQPRYRFPSGFAKSEIVFNLHRAAATGPQTAVVVEGFFDCVKLHQAAYPQWP
jgi:DNA primase